MSTQVDFDKLTGPSKHGIPLLKAPIYRAWKGKVQAFLYEKDLWDVVNDPKPEDRAAATWRSRNNKAKGIISGSVSSEIRDILLEKTDACEMWTYLKSKYEAAPTASAISLQRRLLNARWTTGGIDSFIGNVESTVNHLKQLGETVSEKTVIGVLLNGLPKTWDSFVTSIEGSDPDRLTPDIVMSRLYTEAANRDGRNQGESRPPSQPESAATVRPETRKCYNCGKQGHLSRNCRKPRKERPKESSNKPGFSKPATTSTNTAEAEKS
jgi:hypothetical protein